LQHGFCFEGAGLQPRRQNIPIKAALATEGMTPGAPQTLVSCFASEVTRFSTPRFHQPRKASPEGTHHQSPGRSAIGANRKSLSSFHSPPQIRHSERSRRTPKVSGLPIQFEPSPPDTAGAKWQGFWVTEQDQSRRPKVRPIGHATNWVPHPRRAFFARQGGVSPERATAFSL